MNTQTKQTCENCRFWFYDPEREIKLFTAPPLHDNMKFCHIKAPRGILLEYDKTPKIISVWPETLPSDWCGEWMSEIKKSPKELHLEE